MHYIKVDTLKLFIETVFIKIGLSPKDALICADILITSDLRGIESHGIGRLRMYVERILNGQIEKNAIPKIIRESPTTVVLDGQHGVGMVVAHQAMSLAIEKAKKYGMGSVAVKNSTHFGIDGYYPLMAVKENMIGMSFTNARPSVAPTFGTQPMFGTNPIAFGAPTDEDFPFLFDAATSITQRGKIEVFNRKGKDACEGWVIDPLGQSLTNTQSILNGFARSEASLLPLGGESEALGGHKGYGLAIIVEILSSSLQSGAFLSRLSGLNADGSNARFNVGHFFMAISIESFLPINEFKSNIGNLLRELRASRKMPGQPRIFTAGEKEFYNELEVKQNGVPINEALNQDIQYIRHLLNMSDFETNA